MSNLEIGIAGVVAALALIAIRVPIGLALGLVSIVGIGVMFNMNVAWGMISATPFDYVGQWELSAAPMFLLMGFICSSTDMTRGLFLALRLYLARLPGGLAITSVGACAFFAAASGSSVATASAMSRMAVPEMLNNGYDRGLATGTIAASGTLGSLIPPSVLLILYGVYAQVSVGQLFMAGFIPGLLSALIYMAMIVIRVKLNPSLAGNVEINPTPEERREAFRDVWPLPTLILVVLGGIFTGVFSPTEAGALGAFAAMVIAILRRKLTRAAMIEAVSQAVVSTASIFIILIGSLFFTRFLALSGFPRAFSDAILSVSTETWWILFAVTVIFLVLGMLIDSIGLLLLTLPILVPLVAEADINPVWFGIIVIKLLEIGLITPPIGLNVYMINGALNNRVTLPEIFRGITWFLAMDMLTLLILIAFPILTLWLPSLAY
ncbi:C4-dicarboxylate ABC transporter [Pacificitalea manganoxidans]|uniref:TRAP transporter large permease protein n=1 Tax=Pacificitalea manganoxidans TaxID=1411902 RepID=A0A291LX64_9RHOB|nr:TRAP transporter large permease [Pacificitalea manganoxidans]ATI41281.1 C4-dicarboxylate ABC transporter [Pacificitalea manganoxidans]MDR6308675.1 tripartite ATP-independent transporter DctM subunit [Pacificitalea manganoxidans]OWU69207.1 C4-dicarboxylate ABC transporter [Roseovarius sp. 22II1-1F6A]|tara:strand:- start:173 stop:1480 length:1308 start_codon:yes stop_codon:yes gene_type:complete